ncbi:Glycosyltransferase-like domain-containing protein 1-like [Durusdinium trenchii]|uniref:tRNA-queuosine alpha-mannosyltransferase n=1 Tax=Durusdinium trenchii TaxID=1381693 RepID=A0ABP0ND16_9DINO
MSEGGAQEAEEEEQQRELRVDGRGAAAKRPRREGSAGSGSDSSGLLREVVVVEPFGSGSHLQLCETLEARLRRQGGGEAVRVVTLPGGSKWHWRMLVSSWFFKEEIPKVAPERASDTTVLFVSMLNVAELVGLRPDLAATRKVVFMHENQLEYPSSNEEASKSKGQASFNLVWNQVVSCVQAEAVAFNSRFNMDSFFAKLGPFVNRIPHPCRPTNFPHEQLRAKSRVLFLPVELPLALSNRSWGGPLRLVWAHRWEHDKDPAALMRFVESWEAEADTPVISLAVLGDVSPSGKVAFMEAQAKVAELTKVEIRNWGRLEDKEQYVQMLRTSDLALSTSLHEFFGIAMVEAATCGCFPLCPNRLSYPELFPKDCLYNTDRQLLKKVKSFSRRVNAPRAALAGNAEWTARLERFQWERGLGDQWRNFLRV